MPSERRTYTGRAWVKHETPSVIVASQPELNGNLLHSRHAHQTPRFRECVSRAAQATSRPAHKHCQWSYQIHECMRTVWSAQIRLWLGRERSSNVLRVCVYSYSHTHHIQHLFRTEDSRRPRWQRRRRRRYVRAPTINKMELSGPDRKLCHLMMMAMTMMMTTTTSKLDDGVGCFMKVVDAECNYSNRRSNHAVVGFHTPVFIFYTRTVFSSSRAEHIQIFRVHQWGMPTLAQPHAVPNDKKTNKLCVHLAAWKKWIHSNEIKVMHSRST